MLQEKLGKTEEKQNVRLNKVEDNYQELRQDLNKLEKRVQEAERRPEEQQLSLLGDGIAAIPCGSRNMARESRYWKARQSLRIWPIRGEGKSMLVSLADFLQCKLNLEEEVVEQVKNCTVKRNPNGKDSNIKFEVSVEFPSVEVRDVVCNAAFNLAGHLESGIRLEIAHHLMSNFKALSNASYKLKKKFPDCRRNIKYDLVLDFRTRQSGQWRTLRAEEARKLANDGGRTGEILASDLTELLEEGEEESDEQDFA